MSADWTRLAKTPAVGGRCVHVRGPARYEVGAPAPVWGCRFGGVRLRGVRAPWSCPYPEQGHPCPPCTRRCCCAFASESERFAMSTTARVPRRLWVSRDPVGGPRPMFLGLGPGPPAGFGDRDPHTTWGIHQGRRPSPRVAHWRRGVLHARFSTPRQGHGAAPRARRPLPRSMYDVSLGTGRYEGARPPRGSARPFARHRKHSRHVHQVAVVV